jgi:hypothetical protein
MHAPTPAQTDAFVEGGIHRVMVAREDVDVMADPCEPLGDFVDVSLDAAMPGGNPLGADHGDAQSTTVIPVCDVAGLRGGASGRWQAQCSTSS